MRIWGLATEALGLPLGARSLGKPSPPLMHETLQPTVGTLGWGNLCSQGPVSAAQPAIRLTEATERELLVGKSLITLATEGARSNALSAGSVCQSLHVQSLPHPGRVAAAPLLPWSPPAWSRY